MWIVNTNLTDTNIQDDEEALFYEGFIQLRFRRNGNEHVPAITTIELFREGCGDLGIEREDIPKALFAATLMAETLNARFV